MTILISVLCGFLLDLIFGDPQLPWPHTVVIMGRIISRSEGILRRIFPKTNRGELLAGGILAILLPVGTLVFSSACIQVLRLIHPALGFLLSTYWCWRALALRDLKAESMAVYEALSKNSLSAARMAVARIVGRDTDRLTCEGVAKAAVETVAENFSDGVIAPLFYMMLGGAPLALCYKSINTMDSMIGYRNDQYLYFGRFAAGLDDAANYIPARLSALLLMAAAGLNGQSIMNAWRIWRRDRRKHPSPNSAQCESAMAGALGVELGGDAWYFGTLHRKSTLGDNIRPMIPSDIPLANRLTYTGAVLGLLLFSGLRFLFIQII